MSPSSILYAQLKSLGISYHDAAMTLLKTDLSFAGRPLASRIEERSQLSRRIVHVAPGELSSSMFVDFAISCPALASVLVAKATATRSQKQAVPYLVRHFRHDASRDMLVALAAYDIDTTLYSNALKYIDRLRVRDEQDRLELLLMLFVATGCLGDARFAVDGMVAYALDVLHAEFGTVEPKETAPTPSEPTCTSLALLRIVDGKISANATSHKLSPEGTELGLLSTADHAICDVGEDVSRRHARIWREGDTWYITGLGSTNGTYIVKGHDQSTIVVEPPQAERDKEFVCKPVVIDPTDTIHLGETTSFIVMLAADE